MTDRADELTLRGQYDRERAMLAGADSAWNEAIERSLVIVRGHLALWTWTKPENPNAKISLLIDQLRQVESKICALKRPDPAPDEPITDWHGEPIGNLSRGRLIDALSWCVARLREQNKRMT